MKKKVLITDARLRTSLFAIRSLGRNGVDVTAVDSREVNPLINLGFCSRYCKNRVYAPSVIMQTSMFIESLLEMSQRHDVLLPVSMFSIKAVAENIDRFRGKIKVPIADYDKIIKANDTRRLLEIAGRIGVPIPRMYPVEKIEDIEKISSSIEYPVFIKVRQEEELAPVSRRVIAYNAEDFIVKYRRMHSLQEFPLVQEYIRGRGYGFFALFNKDSRARAVFCHRRIREYPVDGGPSTLCESINEPSVIEYGMRILEELGWYGLAMVEFKMDQRTNKPVLMEINPRIWGSMPLAVFSGVDFPFLLYRMAAEGDIEPVTSFREGVKMRFLLTDVLSAAGYARKEKNMVRIGDFARDLFDFNIKEGIFSLGDPGPGLANSLKAAHKLFLGR